MMSTRADSHNNPTAFTTYVAVESKLRLGVDYEQGDVFNRYYHTARLLGDPVALTIRVIDAIGFYTTRGSQRWTYIGIPHELWLSLSPEIKANVIGGMYRREGGTAMKTLFPHAFLF